MIPDRGVTDRAADRATGVLWRSMPLKEARRLAEVLAAAGLLAHPDYAPTVSTLPMVHTDLLAGYSAHPDDGLRDALRALHKPERRWQPHPDAEFSYGTREEAADEADGGPTYFEVCAQCGELEMRHADSWGDYREALWPCPTIALLTEDGTR